MVNLLFSGPKTSNFRNKAINVLEPYCMAPTLIQDSLVRERKNLSFEFVSSILTSLKLWTLSVVISSIDFK